MEYIFVAAVVAAVALLFGKALSNLVEHLDD